MEWSPILTTHLNFTVRADTDRNTELCLVPQDRKRLRRRHSAGGSCEWKLPWVRNSSVWPGPESPPHGICEVNGIIVAVAEESAIGGVEGCMGGNRLSVPEFNCNRRGKNFTNPKAILVGRKQLIFVGFDSQITAGRFVFSKARNLDSRVAKYKVQPRSMTGRRGGSWKNRRDRGHQVTAICFAGLY